MANRNQTTARVVRSAAADGSNSGQRPVIGDQTETFDAHRLGDAGNLLGIVHDEVMGAIRRLTAIIPLIVCRCAVETVGAGSVTNRSHGLRERVVHTHRQTVRHTPVSGDIQAVVVGETTPAPLRHCGRGRDRWRAQTGYRMSALELPVVMGFRLGGREGPASGRSARS